MRAVSSATLAICAAGLAVLPALAAPITEAPTTLDTPPREAAPLGVPAGVRDARAGIGSTSDSRTIDMLVEMQQPKAGIEFNERAPRGSAGSEVRNRVAPAAAPAPALGSLPPKVETPDMPPTSAAGLFGSGATPPVQTRQAAVLNSGSTAGAPPARSSARPGADVPPELKRWLMWPRQAIDYVRENRGFVIGCTALLLLMGWTASVMLNRRRG